MALSSEDFEQHVIDTLTVMLQAALTATAAHYLAKDQQQGLADSDGNSEVVLDMPAPGLYPDGGWAPGGCDARILHPTVEVAVPDLALENFTLGQTDADAAFTLVICCWHKDARFPVLERTSKRFIAAVHSCLIVPNMLGDATISRARFAWRTNPEQRDADQRIEAGALLVYELASGQVRA
jgi:hypothetical protein